ncbi:MAG TPA: hypothetical protein VHX86_10200 [Tepidisphaeraceae bacterium]|jgi:hypothetical protein|nr:hypothetical protein [Tepidisphaeraceae bacterium]
MLQRIASGFVCIAWALWFGGLGSLFLLVTTLFIEDRETALKAVPRMFLAFERYQLLLAAGALLGAVAWRILAKSIRVTVLFWMLAAASVPAALGPMLITSRMEKLRLNGQSSSPQFKKLHGESMIAYCGETIVLLAVGLTLPWAMREKEKSNGTTVTE